MNNRRTTLLLAASLPLSPFHAWAQAWPERPLRLVVAYPAGGGLDLVARTIAMRLSSMLGQQVVVDNRGGASGSIGAEWVAKAAPDGHTLLLASPAEVVVGPAAGQKTPYRPDLDFTPIALVGETPLVLVVHPGLPVADLREFIAYGKSHPGTLSYGSPGAGSSMHFAGELLSAATGADMTHVPYRGAAPAINDVLGHQISAAIVGMPPVLAHVRGGKLKALAVTTSRRSDALPQVPAISELAGLAGYRFTNWMGLFAPAKLPPAIVERLSTEVVKICREASTRARLADAGVQATGLGSGEFADFLVAERKRYGAIAQDHAIRFSDQDQR